jgi:hypothetical protein
VNPLLGFQLVYYAKTRRLDWMRPTEFGIANKRYDYYLLLPEDRNLIRERHLQVIYADPHSYAMVAVN